MEGLLLWLLLVQASLQPFTRRYANLLWERNPAADIGHAAAQRVSSLARVRHLFRWHAAWMHILHTFHCQAHTTVLSACQAL